MLNFNTSLKEPHLVVLGHILFYPIISALSTWKKKTNHTWLIINLFLEKLFGLIVLAPWYPYIHWVVCHVLQKPKFIFILFYFVGASHILSVPVSIKMFSSCMCLLRSNKTNYFDIRLRVIFISGALFDKGIAVSWITGLNRFYCVGWKDEMEINVGIKR